MCAAMDETLYDMNFSQMPKWVQINETVLVPAFDNTMNEIRDRMLIRCNSAAEQWTDLSNEAITSAIRRYGLRVSTTVRDEAFDDVTPRQVKKQRTAHGTEDDFVTSAIESAIAEKGLR